MQIITEAEMDETLALAELQDEAPNVKPAVEFMDEFLSTPAHIPGDSLPWETLRNRFWLRPGEVTLWTGENGSGKSLITGMAVNWNIPFSRAFVMSMEMKPRETLLRMCQQASGTMQVTRGQKRAWLERTGQGRESNLLIYDQLDTVPAKRVLAVARIAGSTLGCKHIVIDSLTKCGVSGVEKTDKQIEFVDRLQWVAKSTGAHIHLVCHFKKTDDYGKAPTKWAIRGASEISDIADNVVLIWRNRAKEAALEKLQARQPLKEADEAALGQPDTFLRVDKQRHNSWESTVGLWFNREAGQQFVCTKGDALRYPVTIKPAMAEEDEL